MKRRKIVGRILLHFILIHLGMSAVILVMNKLGHPLFRYTKTFPLELQVMILALIDLVSYIIAGFIYGKVFKEKKKLSLVVEWPILIFLFIFLGLYAIMYFLAQTLYNKEIMLFYILFNPWYGTYMWRLGEEQLYSLWWLISTVVPSLGYYIGIKYALKHDEGVVQ